MSSKMKTTKTRKITAESNDNEGSGSVSLAAACDLESLPAHLYRNETWRVWQERE